MRPRLGPKDHQDSLIRTYYSGIGLPWGCVGLSNALLAVSRLHYPPERCQSAPNLLAAFARLAETLFEAQ